MAVKAGQILHAMNQFIVDRIQSGGAGNLNIPQERVYELGNFQSVGIVRDVPDLSFSLDVLDVGTQVECLLVGGTNPDDDTAHRLGDGTAVDGDLYDLTTATTVDIISPFKSAQGAYNIVKGVAVPQLSLESASYKYGLKQNAGETFSLRGDSIYYVPGTPFLVTYTGDGSTAAFNFATLGDAPVNEVQTVTITGAPTGGTFTLTLNGNTTTDLAFDASETDVLGALLATFTGSYGDFTVTKQGNVFTVTFQDGMGGENVGQMTATSSLTGGTSPDVTVDTVTQGSTGSIQALTALTYTELGQTMHALNVSVNGVRKNLGTDYTETNKQVVFTSAPAAGAKIRIVFGATSDASGTPISIDYTQAVNADLSAKPAAIRGRDIKVYIGGLDGSNKWHDVQSVSVDWKVNLDADYEFGNSHAVARDYVDAPDVTGTIEIKSITVDQLFTKLYQITGVNTNDVIGPQSSVTVPIVVQLLNPDSGGTSAHPRGTVLKTLFVPDARFVIPGYEGQVSQKMMSQLQFTSDKGILKVIKGAATASQLGL